MRTLLIVFTLWSAALFGQETEIKNLLSNDAGIAHGGWGAPTFSYTRILDQDAMLIGLRGGWIINHRLTIGIAGSGLVSDVENPAHDALLAEQGMDLKRKSIFRTGYGGILIEPVIAYSKPIHVSLPILIGAGGYGYSTFYDHDVIEERPNHIHDDFHSYFVLQPGIDLELNIIPLLRLGIGASYRYTTDLEAAGTPEDGMRGMNATFSIKVGKF